MKKNKLIVSSLLTMMLSGSLIAGATYSLFTSESTHNISVTSGNVEVTSTLLEDTLKTYSMDKYQGDGVKTFANGGEVSILEGKNINLSNITPGDKVTFDVKIQNLSTVNVKYRVALKCKSGFELFGALEVTCDALTDYKPLEPDALITAHCEISLPTETGNDFKGLDTSLVLSVEAIQGNGEIPSIIDNSFTSDKKTELINKEQPAPLTVTTEKGAASFTIPVARQDQTQNDISVNVTSTNEKGNFTFTNDVYTSYYDISVTNIIPKEQDESEIDCKLFIGKGLTNVKVYHDDGVSTSLISGSSYDANTGFVTFKTTSFSLFAVTADKASEIFNEATPKATSLKFAQAFKDYKAITLGEDITLESTSGALATIDSDVVLNLNGHKLTFNVTEAATNETSLFKVNEAKFEIKSGTGTIESVSSNSSIKTSLVYLNNDNARAILGEATYLGSPYIAKVNKGTAESASGKYGLSTSYKAVAPETSNEIFYRVPEAVPSNRTCAIKLKKGIFTNFNPYIVEKDFVENACYILEGNYATSNVNELGEKIYDSKFVGGFSSFIKNEPTLKSNMYFTFREAGSLNAIPFASGSYNIDLGEYNMYCSIPTFGTLNLGSKTIPAINLSGFGSTNLTITGTTGGIIATNIPDSSTYYPIVVNSNKAVVNINGGHFEGQPSCVSVEKGKVNITGGTFDMTQAQKDGPDGTKYLAQIVNCFDDPFEAGTAKITMTGGTIVGFDPLNSPEGDGANRSPAPGVVYGPHAYVPEGYKTTFDEASNSYTVVLDTQAQ